jgi:hypothetical protein
MARIELRDADVIFQDGLSGTGALTSSPPVATDTDLDIDTVVLNTADTDLVPIGARFTVAGETTATTVHTVASRTNSSGVDAAQSITITATGGTFTLTWGGLTTSAIAYDATNATVKAALVALDDGLTTDDWSVAGSAGGPWTVTFTGAQGDMPQPLMTGDGTSLTGGSTTVTVATTIVGVVAGSTSNIVFTPALGAGTYAENGVVTFLPQQLDIKVGDGNITYTEHRTYDYLLDRGDLDTVREGNQVPMDIKLECVYEHITQGTNEVVSPMDALKGAGGAAEWVSTSSDLCEPYAIDVIILHTPPCGTSENERTTFPDFRADTKEIDFQKATIAVTGKCNAIEPVVARNVT